MTEISTLHSMFHQFHSGLFTFVAFCLLLRMIPWAYWTLTGRSRREGSLIGLAYNYADPAAFLASFLGLAGIVLSALTGVPLWPSRALLASNVPLYKMMFTAFAATFWVMFLSTRIAYGSRLWDKPALAATYISIGFVGAAFTTLTASIGGHMAGVGSVLDPFYEVLGFAALEDVLILDIGVVWALLGTLIVVLIAVLFTIDWSGFQGRLKAALTKG